MNVILLEIHDQTSSIFFPQDSHGNPCTNCINTSIPIILSPHGSVGVFITLFVVDCLSLDTDGEVQCRFGLGTD